MRRPWAWGGPTRRLPRCQRLAPGGSGRPSLRSRGMPGKSRRGNRGIVSSFTSPNIVSGAAPILAKGKRIGLHAGIEELDLERLVGDLVALSNQLIESLLGHHALAGGIDIRSVTVPRRHAVERHT